MKRILTVLAVALVMAVMLVAMAAPAFARANAPATRAPQANAACGVNIHKQIERGLATGSGTKLAGTTNCDQFYTQ